tara:strand:- start:186 stop:329 length:144 start_codon:yes stop_codon:yes gene_type:complete
MHSLHSAKDSLLNIIEITTKRVELLTESLIEFGPRKIIELDELPSIL